MNKVKSLLLVLASVATFSLRAGELTPDSEAKFIKVILSSTGSNKISCSDPALKTALESQGVVVDSGATIAWVTTPNEARACKTFGRLVVTNKRELAATAAIILQEEGGRPKIMLNPTNLHASRVTIGDAILKIAEKI